MVGGRYPRATGFAVSCVVEWVIAPETVVPRSMVRVVREDHYPLHLHDLTAPILPMRESSFTDLHHLQSFFSKEETSGRKEAYDTGHGKRNKSSRNVRRSLVRMGSVRNPAMLMLLPTEYPLIKGSHPDETCLIEAFFAFENECMLDVASSTTWKVQYSQYGLRSRGCSCRVAPKQRGVFEF